MLKAYGWFPLKTELLLKLLLTCVQEFICKSAIAFLEKMPLNGKTNCVSLRNKNFANYFLNVVYVLHYYIIF
jgi:hypothetical protein